MLFTSISQLQSSLYSSAAFQSNVGYLSSGLPDLAVVCIGLTLFTGAFASLTMIIAAFVDSFAICFLPLQCCIQLTFCLAFPETALYESSCFLYPSLPYGLFLPFIPDPM